MINVDTPLLRSLPQAVLARVLGAARSLSCNHADIATEPLFNPPTGLLDFKRGRELEAAGEEAVERALPKLRATLPWLL